MPLTFDMSGQMPGRSSTLRRIEKWRKARQKRMLISVARHDRVLVQCHVLNRKSLKDLRRYGSLGEFQLGFSRMKKISAIS